MTKVKVELQTLVRIPLSELMERFPEFKGSVDLETMKCTFVNTYELSGEEGIKLEFTPK